MTWFDTDEILILSGSHGSLSPIHNLYISIFSLFRAVYCLVQPSSRHPSRKRLSSHLAPLTLILKKGGKTIETICLDFKELGRESSNLGQVGIRSTWEISEKTPVPQWSLSLKPPTPTPQRGSLKREAPC